MILRLTLEHDDGRRIVSSERWMDHDLSAAECFEALARLMQDHPTEGEERW